MEAKLIKIGNSRGVRLPATVIRDAGLTTIVELDVRKGVVTIRPAKTRRTGWAEGARACHDHGDERWLLGSFGNAFDEHW